ncbi:MAG TPA: response regulator, partial [Thermoanaerobaculia bacterium]
DRVMFHVADTGIGIAPDDQERIFDDFTQIDNPLQRMLKGTGLGLPLTRKLATLLGGRVGVRSSPGLGSTFWAEIPIRHASAGQEVAPEPVVNAEPSNAAPGNLRVLVIDDDETARYAISSFAARPGTQVMEAENGLAGIARAQADHPDVILLDLMMPGVGGHEVLQRLKSDPNTAATPVVIITSRFVNDDERRQILTRAVTVLYKGDLSREAVTRAIDTALAQ